MCILCEYSCCRKNIEKKNGGDLDENDGLIFIGRKPHGWKSFGFLHGKLQLWKTLRRCSNAAETMRYSQAVHMTVFTVGVVHELKYDFEYAYAYEYEYYIVGGEAQLSYLLSSD